jgi:hypothetical protein
LTKIKDNVISRKKRGGYLNMPIRMNGIKYFLTEDIADMIPLSQKAIQGYIKKGRIHGIKIGRSWYISNASINEFLQTGGPKKVTTE